MDVSLARDLLLAGVADLVVEGDWDAATFFGVTAVFLSATGFLAAAVFLTGAAALAGEEVLAVADFLGLTEVDDWPVARLFTACEAVVGSFFIAN